MIGFTLLAPGVVSAQATNNRAQSTDSNLMMWSGATPPLAGFTDKYIDRINASPYTDVYVPLISAYDPNQYTFSDFQASLSNIQKRSRAHVIPGIFLNRMIGYDPPQSTNTNAAQPYFEAIQGMDIFNKTGALDDFYNLFQMGLQSAQAIDSPGIWFDPEAYNNYSAYSIPYLATEQGVTQAQVETQLEAIGAHLADITAETYPTAIIWTAWTRLNTVTTSVSPAWIMQGMLQEAVAKGMEFKVLNGGEIALGYCAMSLDDLDQNVATYDATYAPILAQYPGVLQLSGTIAPWADASQKTGWMTDTTGIYAKCGNSSLQTASDFEPLFVHLLQQYQYVWIYAAGVAPYQPYDPSNAAPYNTALAQALRTFDN